MCRGGTGPAHGGRTEQTCHGHATAEEAGSPVGRCDQDAAVAVLRRLYIQYAVPDLESFGVQAARAEPCSASVHTYVSKRIRCMWNKYEKETGC